MSHSIYSHSVRVLACATCGAPLDAALEGGRFHCAYCGAPNVVSRRDEAADRARPSEGASLSEAERLARLRIQELEGAPIPPVVARLLVGPHLPKERAREARQMWNETRAELARRPSGPLEERFFHLTLVLAPLLLEPEARSILETAVELLPDRGHRHVLRCQLAFAAACALEVRAAEEWLELCDPRPLSLALDSPYRAAFAASAIARGEPSRALSVLGTEPGDVPLSRREEASCIYLRLDALERIGSKEAAGAELLARARRGVDVREELGRFRRLELCPAAFRATEAAASAGRIHCVATEDPDLLQATVF